MHRKNRHKPNRQNVSLNGIQFLLCMRTSTKKQKNNFVAETKDFVKNKKLDTNAKEALYRKAIKAGIDPELLDLSLPEEAGYTYY